MSWWSKNSEDLTSHRLWLFGDVAHRTFQLSMKFNPGDAEKVWRNGEGAAPTDAILP